MAATYYKEFLSQAAGQAVHSLVAARRARWEIARALDALAQNRNAPQYRDMQAAYQQLSARIELAQQALQERQDRLASELGPANPLGRFHNFIGVGRLGPATLGPAEPKVAGMVSSGEDVMNLQKFLRAVGFQLNPTGEFDLQTRLVLQKFQEEHELPNPAETIVGAETRQLINDLIEGK